MKHLLLIALLAGAAHADKRPVLARVADIEVRDDARIVTVLAGSEQGIKKTWRAKFPVEGGEAIVIRVDKRTTVLKTSLTAEQIRANRTIQLGPS